MALTLTATPTYPAPGKPCKLTFASGAGGQIVKLFATTAPVGTLLRKEIDDSQLGRKAIGQCDIAGYILFAPEKPGVYVFAAEEYTGGAFGYGGGYERDPNASPSETFVSTTVLSLSVGSRLTCTMGTGPDLVTLTFWVFGADVRATTLEHHGEVTPTLSNPTSPKAAAAMEVAAVRSAIAAFVGNSATTIVGTPATVIDNLIQKYEAHRVSVVFHANADADNSISGAFRDPSTPDGVANSATEFLLKLDRHMRNTWAGGVGPGSGNYHLPGGVSRADWANIPLVQSAGPLEPLSQVIALADAWRAYEAHRISSVHAASDTTNTATALPLLHEAHRLFLVELKKTSPTAGATVNTGVPRFVYSGGMTEEN